MSVDPHTAGLPGTIVHDEIVPSRAPWLHHVAAGQTLRIVDLEGNQAVDFLLYATADDAERYSAQDTVACSCESNTLRYGHHTKAQHACVESFLEANLLEGRSKRDIVSNINFFMNVPVEADGALGIVDGISAPGLTVDLRAEMDVTVVVSNCPQINNPCNAFNPTPVRMIVAA